MSSTAQAWGAYRHYGYTSYSPYSGLHHYGYTQAYRGYGGSGGYHYGGYHYGGYGDYDRWTAKDCGGRCMKSAACSRNCRRVWPPRTSC
jgi:hypothetical protein